MNYDEQIQLLLTVSYKVYTLRPKKERQRKPWRRPSRRTIQRYLKKFKLKTSKAQVQTLARYSHVYSSLMSIDICFIIDRYESVRDHRNFISLFCALEGLREMFGYEDPKTGTKKFNWSNCLSFDESTGCTLLQYGSTRVLKRKNKNGQSSKPPVLVVKKYVYMIVELYI